MKVRPLGDKILVKRDEAATKTESGIFLPESAKDKPKQGTVIALGAGILNKEKGTYVPFTVKKGDTVIFSSRVIPGNERAIGTVQDNLVRRGVHVITDDDHVEDVAAVLDEVVKSPGGA